MVKKLFAWGVAVVFVLVGCGKSGETPTATPTKKAEETTKAAAKTPPAAAKSAKAAPAAPQPTKPEPKAPSTPPAKPAQPAKPQPPKPEPPAPAKPAPTGPENLLKSGRFEEGYAGWQLTKGQKVKIKADDKTACVGRRSLRFDLANATGFTLTAWIPKGFESGAQYQFNGYIKLDGVKGKVRFTGLTDNGKKSGKVWTHTEQYSGTQGWTETGFLLDVPSKTKVIAVRVDYEKPSGKTKPAGTFWVDEVSLTPAPKEAPEKPANLLQNGDFEQGTAYWQGIPKDAKTKSDQEDKLLVGDKSLRIELGDTKNFNIIQWIKDAEPNAKYRLEGYMKTKDLQGSALFTGLADSTKNPGKTWAQSQQLSGTTNWSKLSFDLATKADQDILGMRIDYRSPDSDDTKDKGAIWVDNVTLTKLP